MPPRASSASIQTTPEKNLRREPWAGPAASVSRKTRPAERSETVSTIYSATSPTATPFAHRRQQYRPTGLGTRPVPGWKETVAMLRIAIATAKTRAPQTGGPSAEEIVCALIDRVGQLGVRECNVLAVMIGILLKRHRS
jgi:hypothetical protein